MFKDRLLEELGVIFGESPLLWSGEQSGTNESIYISINDCEIKVTEDHSINFSVPFSVTIFSDRNDFYFGYITTKFHSYKPNENKRLITTIDDSEYTAWVGNGKVSITKNFLFNYTTEYNLQTKKLDFNKLE
jgi:hypothetical protein